MARRPAQPWDDEDVLLELSAVGRPASIPSPWYLAFLIDSVREMFSRGFLTSVRWANRFGAWIRIRTALSDQNRTDFLVLLGISALPPN
ncbi:MAG: hypothetical protein Q9191_004073 [Dirinaria sp. TL-2023a]